MNANLQDLQFHLDRIHLGVAPPGSVLRFQVHQDVGFIARAALDCDLKTVASWEWVELQDSQIIDEILIPSGTYTLQVDVVFISPPPPLVEVAIGFSVTRGDQADPSPLQFLTLEGARPDMGRVLAAVLVP